MQHHQYLESKILTASQPQLHLMLIEGALRFGRRALEVCQDAEQPPEDTDRLLDKTVDIVEEMVNSVSSGRVELSEQLEEQYAYMFRELVACRFNRDSEKLSAVLTLLEFEQETWQQACHLCQQSGDSIDKSPASDKVTDQTSSTQHSSNAPSTISDRLSLEA